MANNPYLELVTKLSERFKKDLIDNLIQDGRNASGDLIKSVESVVSEIFFGVQAEIHWLYYGSFFETGVPASKIPFSGTRKGSGSKRISKYIQGLVRWVILKGIATGLNKNPLSIAFAIAHKHKKRGMPLDKNIKIMTRTIDQFTPYLEKEMQAGVQNIIFGQIDNMISGISKNLQYVE